MPSKPVADDWYTANHRYLMGLINQTRQVLEGMIAHREQGHQGGEKGIFIDYEQDPAFAQAPPALERLCQVFHLSPCEREVLLLCAGMEFDRNWGQLCAKAQGQPKWEYPTLSLALSISSSPHWNALTQDAALRRWRLIEIGSASALTISPLRLDEQITHYLAGLQPLDERLAQLGFIPLVMDNLVPSHIALAEQMANCWVQAAQERRVLPILQLCGTDAASKKAIAAHTCDTLGLTGYVVAAQNVPRESHQLHLVRCLWEREWRLYGRVMLLDGDRLESTEGERENHITQLLDTLQAPLIITSLERRCSIQRPLLTLDVHHPTPAEQRQLWQTVISAIFPNGNGHIDHLVSHFHLSTATITATSWQFKAQHNPDSDSAQTFHSLWDVCRSQARPRLDELAQRIEATAQWEDLVLPPNELGVLRDIAAHLRQRFKVYEQWGFADKGGRGLGISAMFAGASGTGKTLAAEVLGNTLNLDVYRIDLSAVVSKYIGETEKNLRRVFDVAEGGGVILLFDEADALFGKRTEVKDSHDRHANIEVSYLLQRMEAYRGLAILTTNLKTSLDQAFLRRLRFIVQFPFPDANQRAEIWRRVFPTQTPTADLDFDKLAKLSVSGGNIRNIALNAAFLAADADEPVGMKHILQAAKSEYIKMERPLTDVEVKGWV